MIACKIKETYSYSMAKHGRYVLKLLIDLTYKF